MAEKHALGNTEAAGRVLHKGRVLISGGGGLIGRHLSAILLKQGYEVALLSRQGALGETMTYRWDPARMEIDPECLQEADYIIHLSGANLGEKRWTRNRKREIVDSRVNSARLILENLPVNHRPQAFISASAIGYYGAVTVDRVFKEDDPPASDFLGETCRQWEQAASGFAGAGIRTVCLRTGIVLAGRGGALENMLQAVRMGVAPVFGDGLHFMPWIHIEDLCRLYLRALEDASMQGPYNAVAPEHRTNREFAALLKGLMKKRIWMSHIPGWLMKLVFGEMSDMLLNGSRVSAEKIIQSGYRFLFPDLENALSDLLESRSFTGQSR